MGRRVIDQELDWYFRYAEAAHRLGGLKLLPTHESAALATVAGSDKAVERRAVDLVRTVEVTLDRLSTRDAGVLRAVYTPRRWPVVVEHRFQRLTAIAVRLVCAADPWPARTPHDGLETAAAQQLARLLARPSARPALLRREARRLMNRAVSAYSHARSQGGLPIAE